ncbi:MAG: type I DNA topoisomerase [Leptospirales bacterium]
MATKTKKSKKTKTLIVVESPTKIRSLAKFLGPDYRIESSKGHLIDLPKSKMGIDIENNFEAQYITIRGKGKDLAELKKAAKSSVNVLLATDPDREGEAISWHLERALSAVNDNIQRIEFNEITEEAVKDAISHPREIDMLMVNSQQARRLLDRLVGYSISPILQEKFSSKRFSAGRVQSAALKIITVRENEIKDFKPVEFWEVESTFEHDLAKAKDKAVIFKLVQVGGEKVNITNGDTAQHIEETCLKQSFSTTVRKISERKSKPPTPYITSRLQQDASTRLGYRAQKTMSVAQSLYEGVDLGEGGPTGLITYMRTDSTRISEAGLGMARSYIKEKFSSEYLPEKANIYASKKSAQDAHEAIRPTDVMRTPASISQYLSRDQFKLYDLIWKRFVGSQMTTGVDELVTIEVLSNDEMYLFRFSSGRQTFPGYRAVFPSGENKKEHIPKFEPGLALEIHTFEKMQKFTQPPPRYTEASLIRKMEESGIGRPATYVPTMATLDKRSYIERKGRQILPTQLGMLVSGLLQDHFADIVDLEFTANLEETLDDVAKGTIAWKKMLGDFFFPFQDVLKAAGESMPDMSHIIRIPIGRDCPDCGNALQKKLGKNGYFIGCANFAGGCRYTESIPLGKCPLCAGNVVSKASKKGRKFYGCENYASSGCEFTMLDKPSQQSCPQCESIMGQKVKKSGITLTCQNPACKFVMEQKTD